MVERARSICGLIILALMIVEVCAAQERTVDFRYAPQQSFTAICLPEDWLKTVVISNGALGYEFGPGPYARPLTEISVGVDGEELRVDRQYLDDPRVPIVTTLFSGNGVTSRQEAFAIVPAHGLSMPDSIVVGSVMRIGGVTGCAGWASPAGDVDPAFRNVAWGTNRPIKYLVKVKVGSRKRIALGLCESYKGSAGARILELRVEGALPVTFDAMKDGVKNRPSVAMFDGQDSNGDGFIEVESHASPRSPDPNVILNAFWIFPEDSPVTPDEIIKGEASAHAETYYSCGIEAEKVAPQARADAIIATFAGKGVTPVVVVRSPRTFKFDERRKILTAEGAPAVVTRPLPLRAVRQGNRTLLEFARGVEKVEVISLHGPRGAVPAVGPLNDELVRADRYWRSGVGFPNRSIVVPDSGIQYLVDANIRNMYQVAEYVDGRLQFQPGPSVYRGLWVADAMLTGIPVAMVGDGASLSRFIESGLRCQAPDGQIRSLYPSESLVETPMVIFSILWYARATGDSAWLRSLWPAVSKGIEWCRQARGRTFGNPTSPYYGLMPPGFIDGGISTPAADYGTLWWVMVALERGISSAKWLGKTRQASEWQTLLDEFLVSFRRAARRDLRRDAKGTLFLPIMVGDSAVALPQQGQYAFLLPLRYGDFFQRGDPLIDSVVNGNLTMLDSASSEGLIANSGWVRDGVWPWLGGAHGLAYNSWGNPDRTIDLLYAFANHASRAGTWMEEQQIKGLGSRTGGDGSDAEASATFLHLVRSLLIIERSANLELLSALPPSWLTPGARVEINNGLTEFGPVTVRLAVANDGQQVSLNVSPVDGRGSPGIIIVHLKALKEKGYIDGGGHLVPDLMEWHWGKGLDLTLRK